MLSYVASLTTGPETALMRDKEDHHLTLTLTPEDKAPIAEAPQDEAEKEACPRTHTRCQLPPGNTATTMTNEVAQCPEKPRQIKSSQVLKQPDITFESKPINMANGMISDTHAPHNSEALSQEEIKLREDIQSKLAQIFLNQALDPHTSVRNRLRRT
ncbi:unnamed protein product [Pleuronectes platessa]|uniref:Uncharacterized protein n=1 Tax=Pleuronectes platessa TaxID=8262 RepID=A0A9N7TV28_PLEPL|nr:unnamed protein product [Pleuronectes platessa]